MLTGIQRLDLVYALDEIQKRGKKKKTTISFGLSVDPNLKEAQ